MCNNSLDIKFIITQIISIIAKTNKTNNSDVWEVA